MKLSQLLELLHNLWGQSACCGGLGRLAGLAGRSLLWSCRLLPLFGFLCVMVLLGARWPCSPGSPSSFAAPWR